jgi:hypothetical protein
VSEQRGKSIWVRARFHGGPLDKTNREVTFSADDDDRRIIYATGWYGAIGGNDRRETDFSWTEGPSPPRAEQ